MRTLPRSTALAALIVLLHFQLLSVAGFGVTLAYPSLLLLLWLTDGSVSSRALPWLVLALVLPLLPAATEGVPSWAEFGRTYVLWSVAVTSVAVAVSGSLQRERVLQLRSGLWMALVVVCAFSVAQYLAGRAGHAGLFSPFGSHTYQFALNVTPHDLDITFVRARGFYLEPSFNALVITTLLFCLVTLRHRVLPAFAVASVGLLVTNSVAGYLVFAVTALHALRMAPRRTHARSSRVIVGLFAATTLIVASGYLTSRWASLSTPGTSANYRVVAPLQVLSDALASGPLGQPFGSLSTFIYRADLANGSGVGTTLDNGVYYLLFYFGAYSVAGIIYSVWLLVSRRAGHIPGGRLAVVWGLLTLGYTGGIVLPDFILLLALGIVCCRSTAGLESIDRDAAALRAVERVDQLTRPAERRSAW